MRIAALISENVDETTPLMSARSGSSGGDAEDGGGDAEDGADQKVAARLSTKQRWQQLRKSVQLDSAGPQTPCTAKTSGQGSLAASMMRVVSELRVDAKRVKKRHETIQFGKSSTAEASTEFVDGTAAGTAIGMRLSKFEDKMEKLMEGMEGLRRRSFTSRSGSKEDHVPVRTRSPSPDSGATLPDAPTSNTSLSVKVQECLDMQRQTLSDVGRMSRTLLEQIEVVQKAMSQSVAGLGLWGVSKESPSRAAAALPALAPPPVPMAMLPSPAAPLAPPSAASDQVQALLLERFQELLEVQQSTLAEVGQVRRQVAKPVSGQEGPALPQLERHMETVRTGLSELPAMEHRLMRRLDEAVAALAVAAAAPRSSSAAGCPETEHHVNQINEIRQVVDRLEAQLDQVGGMTQAVRRVESQVLALAVAAPKPPGDLADAQQARPSKQLEGRLAILDELRVTGERTEAQLGELLGMRQQMDRVSKQLGTVQDIRQAAERIELQLKPVSDLQSRLGRAEMRLAALDELRLLSERVDAQMEQVGALRQSVERTQQLQLRQLTDVLQVSQRLEEQLCQTQAGHFAELREASRRLEGRLSGAAGAEQLAAGLAKLERALEPLEPSRQATELIEGRLREDAADRCKAAEALDAQGGQLRDVQRLAASMDVQLREMEGTLKQMPRRIEEQGERIGGFETVLKRVEGQFAAKHEEAQGTLRQVLQSWRQWPASVGKSLEDLGASVEEQGRGLFELLRRLRESPKELEVACRESEARLMESLRGKEDHLAASLAKQLAAVPTALAAQLSQQRDRGPGALDDVIKAELEVQLAAHTQALDRSIRARSDSLEQLVRDCFARPAPDVGRQADSASQQRRRPPESPAAAAASSSPLGGPPSLVAASFAGSASYHDGTSPMSPSATAFSGSASPTSETQRRRQELSRRLQELGGTGGGDSPYRRGGGL